MTVKAVYFTSAATRQWRSLSADIRRRIDAKLMTYVISGSGDVKRLKGHGGGCRLRVGDWHFIFIEDARSITVIAVGNRREIYD
jgi:mRNA interferase RelE/StbE